MTLPDIVQSNLGDEQVAAQVDLGGEDQLFVTPTRTLIYRADGLLSDESVEEFPHNAERVDVTEKRRKTKISLEYGLDGTRSFTVSNSRVDDALHPVLAGVLNAAGVTDPGETVKQTYLFSELTIVVTSARVIKHIGASVWDEEFEEFHYDDVTRLAFEEGSVATQVVIEADGRPQRIKAPNEQARDLRERLEGALFDHYDVRTMEEFDAAVRNDESDEPDETDDDADGDSNVAFGDGVQPLDADPPDLEDQSSDDAPDAGATARGSRPEAAVGSAKTTDTTPDGDASANQSATVSGATPNQSATDADVTQVGDEHAAASSESDDSEQDASESDSKSTDRDRIADEDEILEDPGAASESSDDLAVIENRLDALAETVERQNELLTKQQETIETLIDELSRGR